MDESLVPLEVLTHMLHLDVMVLFPPLFELILGMHGVRTLVRCSLGVFSKLRVDARCLGLPLAMADFGVGLPLFYTIQERAHGDLRPWSWLSRDCFEGVLLSYGDSVLCEIPNRVITFY